MSNSSTVGSIDVVGSSGGRSSSSTSVTSSQSILSEKVTRALQVRTDTPAMKAALDALSNLHEHNQHEQQREQQQEQNSSSSSNSNKKDNNNNTNSNVMIDSRSVRIAIERDALQQAIQLQDELQKLVFTIQSLRNGVSQIASCSRSVKQAIHMNVNIHNNNNNNNKSVGGVGGGGGGSSISIDGGVDGTTTSMTTMLPGLSSAPGSSSSSSQNKNNDVTTPDDETASPSTTTPSASASATATTTMTSSSSASSSSSLEDEQRLALTLHDAFLHRDQCRRRLESVQAFLEKYNLSERDSMLLDHYNFEDVNNNTTTLLLQMAANANRDPASAADDDVDQQQHQIVDGIAFLEALDRVRKIRQALTDNFDHTTTTATTSTTDLQQQQQQQQQASSSSLDVDDMMMIATEKSGGGRRRGNNSNSNSNHAGLGTSSALRMMESLAQKQERAYERLYHWLQNYLQMVAVGSTTTKTPPAAAAGGGGGSTNDTLYHHHRNDVDHDTFDEALQNMFIRRSLYTLRHVPAFYTHTLELISSSRRTEQTRKFLLALTHGYDDNLQQQPIEMKAHDPVAYIGDMLAFSFRAFSVEADVACGLLRYKPELYNNEENDGDVEDDDNNEANENKEDDGLTIGGTGGPNDSRSSFTVEDKAMSAREMLSIAVSGLARPLRSRIVQVVATLSRRIGDDDDDDDDDVHHDGMMMNMMGGGSGGTTNDFEEEGNLVRVRVTQLYEICGLLLFYASAMSKSIKKLGPISTNQLPDVQEEKEGADDDDDDLDNVDQDDDGISGSGRSGGSTNNNNKKNNDIIVERVAKNNPLVSCLYECLLDATNAYEASIRVYCGTMLEQISILTGDTQSYLVYTLLKLIINVRIKSPGYSMDVYCPKECKKLLSIEWITETLINAALISCSSLDDIISLKESIINAKDVGNMSIIVAQRLDEAIISKEHTIIDILVETETQTALEICGLSSLVSAWTRWQDFVLVQKQQKQKQEGAETDDDAGDNNDINDDELLMSSYPGLSQDIVSKCIKEFYISLFSPPLPSLEDKIQNNSTLRKMARNKIANNVCDVYTELYQCIIDDIGYDNPKITFLTHTPEQVKTLFSV